MLVDCGAESCCVCGCFFVAASCMNSAHRTLGEGLTWQTLSQGLRAVMCRQRPRLEAFWFCFLVANKLSSQYSHCTVDERADVLILKRESYL